MQIQKLRTFIETLPPDFILRLGRVGHGPEYYDKTNFEELNRFSLSNDFLENEITVKGPYIYHAGTKLNYVKGGVFLVVLTPEEKKKESRRFEKLSTEEKIAYCDENAEYRKAEALWYADHYREISSVFAMKAQSISR